LILIVFTEYSAYSQDKQEKVNGGYKECVIYKTDYKKGKLDINSKYKEHDCLYDSKGKKISEIKYQPSGDFVTKELCHYDSKGRIDTVKGYIKADTADYSYYLYYVYDAEGELIESGRVESDTHDSIEHTNYNKGTYKYDSKKNLIEKTEILSDGSNGLKCTYRYDSKNNKIEEVITKPDDSVLSRTSYKYDKNKNIIEKVILVKYERNEKEFNQKYKYKYDALGNETEEIIYYRDLKEPTEKREYKYSK
jgi:hypothetical protein